MTYITQIFGKDLRDTHEYVGWANSKEGIEFIEHLHAIRINTSSTRDELIEKAHTILSQEMREEWFVRPEEPLARDFFEDSHGFYDAHQQWADYQPMFKEEFKMDEKGRVCHKVYGEWRLINGFEGSYFKYLNDFATYCQSKKIPLELNENYEV